MLLQTKYRACAYKTPEEIILYLEQFPQYEILSISFTGHEARPWTVFFKEKEKTHVEKLAELIRGEIHVEKSLTTVADNT